LEKLVVFVAISAASQTGFQARLRRGYGTPFLQHIITKCYDTYQKFAYL
jgi:hypothetical protein